MLTRQRNLNFGKHRLCCIVFIIIKRKLLFCAGADSCAENFLALSKDVPEDVEFIKRDHGRVFQITKPTGSMIYFRRSGHWLLSDQAFFLIDLKRRPDFYEILYVSSCETRS